MSHALIDSGLHCTTVPCLALTASLLHMTTSGAALVCTCSRSCIDASNLYTHQDINDNHRSTTAAGERRTTTTISNLNNKIPNPSKQS